MSQQMLDDILFTTNLFYYDELYADPFEKRSFEVRSKTQIFKSLQNKQEISLSGKKVLDVGFGSGDILLTVSRQGAECFGIEIAKTAVASLKQRCPSFHIFESRASSLPFNSDFFDIIICSHVLEHETNEAAAIQEMVRVLNPGGMIFLGVPGVAVGETELHARLYKAAVIQVLADRFHLEVLCSYAYGSRIFQIIYHFISGIAALVSADNKKIAKIEFSQQGVDRYSIIRKLHHFIVVPFLLFLYRLDAIMPMSKDSPIEIWAILRKKNK